MNYSNMSYIEILKEIFKPFSRNLLYLLMSLPFGIIYFTFAVCGISLGVGTSIIYMGVPITASTLIFAKRIVDYEKFIAAKMLNTNINMITGSVDSNNDQGIIKKMIGVIKDWKNWRSIFYCIMKLPISIMYFTIATCLPILSIGCVCQPINFIVMKKFGIDIYKNNITVGDLLGIQLPNSVESILYFIAGIGITVITVKVINNLAEISAKFTLKF